MNLNDFDFNLPKSLISQHPSTKRDHSKLLVLDRKDETIKHEKFYDITNYLKPNSVLVLNNTKVLPARLIGIKEETEAVIELLLLNELENKTWEVLIKPAKRVKVGTIITFGNNLLKAQVTKKLKDGLHHVTFMYEGIFLEILEQLGKMPLPPYITEELNDKTRYNTVYAKEIGSSAAPTAGLHFTNDLLKEITKKNITICYITLHVGLGTFRPVNTEDITKHEMHEEKYYMSLEVANILNNAKLNNQPIIAVGTTTVRTLETIMNKHNTFKADYGSTNIFIYPGYQFKAIDHLITNFHLPKSTLLMLVSAFSNREYILRAYDEAIKNNYRFFSFGDAMLIL